MKNKLYKNLIVLFYILSFFIILFCIKVRLTSRVYLNTNIRLVLLFIACILIYINGYILTKKLNYNKKVLKLNLIIYFIIYIVIICTLTLFDELYGRNGLIVANWNKELLEYYINNSFNIIPFRTIKLFVSGYNRGIVSFNDFIVNVIGNFLAFMPFAIFIPLIFKKINKYYKFLITMIFIVVIIEVLQFITMSGACDIDDLILNVLGASIIYFIIKIKPVNKFINKIFLYE